VSRPAHVVEVRHVADCPHLGAVLDLVQFCLDTTAPDADLIVREGIGLSPTVLVDGRDVTGESVPTSAVGCRLDLPTAAQIIAALEGASS